MERLPVEVFDLVAAHLDLPAYQNLRLASRQLHSLTFSTFTKQCFSERTTTLGSTSLGRLVEISKHDHLRSVVRALHIRLLNHRDYKTLKAISRVGIFPPPKRFPRVSGVRDEHINDEATTYDYVVKTEYPKRILDDLARALRGFSNLKTIRFRAKNSDRDGWLNSVPDGDQLFRAKCFQVVIDALMQSEVKLEEFSMAKGKRNTTLYKRANLPHTAFQLSPQTLQALQDRFSNLESLTISAMCNDDTARVPGWANSIGTLVATAPKLKSLALSLDRITLFRPHHAQGAAVFRSLAVSCRIQCLERFQLINCFIHAEHLDTFVRAHGSLQQVIFSEIELLSGNWTSVWGALKEVGGLRSLRLADVMGTGSPVAFRRRKNGRTKITLDTVKDERPMSKMLDDLIAARDAEVDVSNVSNVDGD
jgi:hypothetical protein